MATDACPSGTAWEHHTNHVLEQRIGARSTHCESLEVPDGGGLVSWVRGAAPRAPAATWPDQMRAIALIPAVWGPVCAGLRFSTCTRRLASGLR